jgi:hypothetical protein
MYALSNGADVFRKRPAGATTRGDLFRGAHVEGDEVWATVQSRHNG